MKRNPFVEKLGRKYQKEIVPWLVLERETSERQVDLCEFSYGNKLFKLYNREEFLKNPYIKNVKFTKFDSANYVLSRARIHPTGCIEKFAETTFDENNLSFNHSFFYCMNNLKFPVLYEKSDNKCWMSVEPFEINSFKKIINDAQGNVLLLGLGLGYLPYMLSIKDSVSKITVVEIDEEIINIFKENIFCWFENKDKVQIINDNACDYLRQNDLNKYNYINMDIWKTTSDMLPYYLQTIGIEKKYPQVNFSYWLEQEFKCEVQRAIYRAVIQQPLNDDLDEFAGQIVKKKVNSTSEFIRLIKLDKFRDVMYNFYLKYQNIYDKAVEDFTSQYVKKINRK